MATTPESTLGELEFTVKVRLVGAAEMTVMSPPWKFKPADPCAEPPVSVKDSDPAVFDEN